MTRVCAGSGRFPPLTGKRAEHSEHARQVPTLRRSCGAVLGIRPVLCGVTGPATATSLTVTGQPPGTLIAVVHHASLSLSSACPSA